MLSRVCCAQDFLYTRSLADQCPLRWFLQEGEDLAADSHQFVSSVCWSRKGHMLLAANSQGTLKLLELD